MALTFSPLDDFGSKLPSFNLPSIKGEMFSSSRLITGKPSLVVFICNHCPYVKAIEDRLIQLGSDLKKLEIPMVAICSNDSTSYPEDGLAGMKKRAEEKSYSFEYLHDESQQIAQQFGAVCTPDFFMYDSDGLLRYRGRLDDNWKDSSQVKKRELFEAALELLETGKVTQTQTPSMGCSLKWKESK